MNNKFINTNLYQLLPHTANKLKFIIYSKLMNLHILLFTILFLTGLVASNDQQQTTLTFLVEYEDQQEEDYIELGLVVTAQGTSLVNVMNEALRIAKKIQTIAINFCQIHTKKKTECKQIVQIGNSNINPKYQVVKRQSKFMGFKVEYQLSIKVLAIDYISDLADTILKQKNTKIISFEWKPLEEVNKQEAAVKQGTQQGEELCDQIGMHLASISNVEEMTESATEQTAVYMFKVNCQPGKKVQKQPVKEDKSVKQDTKKPQQKKEKKTDDKKAEQKKEKKEKKEKKTSDKKQKKEDTKKQKKAEQKKQKKAEVKKQNQPEDKNQSKPSTSEL